MRKRAPTMFVVTNTTPDTVQVVLHAPALDGGTHALRIPGPDMCRTGVGRYSTYVPDAMWQAMERDVALAEALDRFDRDRGLV